MEDIAAESNITKAENGKEMKFSEETTELKSGIKIYTWQLEPQNVTLRYDYLLYLYMFNTFVDTVLFGIYLLAASVIVRYYNAKTTGDELASLAAVFSVMIVLISNFIPPL